MDFLEKDLEEIIYNADRELLENNGLLITGKLLRQVRIGNYGVADLIEISRETDPRFHTKNNFAPLLRIKIYELKKDKIGISAFLQAVRYLKGVKRYLEDVRGFGYDIIYDIVLIGRCIDLESSYSYLSELVPENHDSTQWLYNFTYKYDIDGLKFKEEYGYELSNEGF